MLIFIESFNYKNIIRYKARQLAQEELDPHLAQRVRDDIRQATSPEKVMLTLDRWVHVLAALSQNVNSPRFPISHAVYSGIIDAIQGTPLQAYLPCLSSDYLNQFATLDQQYSHSTGSEEGGIGLFLGEGSESGSPVVLNSCSNDSAVALPVTTVVSTVLVQPAKATAFSDTVKYLQRALLKEQPDIAQLANALRLWSVDRVTAAFNEASEATLAQSMLEQMRALVQGSIKGLDADLQAKVLFGWWGILDALHEEGHDCVVDALLAIEEIQNSCAFVDQACGEAVKGNADTLKLFMTLRLPSAREGASFSVIQQFEQCRHTHAAVTRRLSDTPANLTDQNFFSVSIDLFIDLYEARQEAISKIDEAAEQKCQDWLNRLWQIYDAIIKEGKNESSGRDFAALESEVRLVPLKQKMLALQLDIKSIQAKYATVSSKSVQPPLELHRLLKAIKDWPGVEATVAKSSDETAVYGRAFLELFLANEALVKVVLASGYGFNPSVDEENYEALKTCLKKLDLEEAKELLVNIFIDSLPSWQVKYVLSDLECLDCDCVAQDGEVDETDEFSNSLTDISVFSSYLRLSQSNLALDSLTVSQPNLQEKCLEIFEEAHGLIADVSKMAFYRSLQKNDSRESPTTVKVKHALLQDFSKQNPSDASAKSWRKIVKGCEQLGYGSGSAHFAQLDQELMMRLQLYKCIYNFLEKDRKPLQKRLSPSFLSKLSGLTPMMKVMRLQHHVDKHPSSDSVAVWDLARNYVATLKAQEYVTAQDSLNSLMGLVNGLYLLKIGKQPTDSDVGLLKRALEDCIQSQLLLPTTTTDLTSLTPNPSHLGGASSMSLLSSSMTSSNGLKNNGSEVELIEKVHSPARITRKANQNSDSNL